MRNKKLLLPLLLLLFCLLVGCGGSDVGVIGGADGPTEIIVSHGAQKVTLCPPPPTILGSLTPSSTATCPSSRKRK